MAQIQKLLGSHSLREAYPIINTNEENLNKELLELASAIIQHGQLNIAHAAEQISVSIPGLTAEEVKAAIIELIARINNIVASSGTGNTEIVDARMGADGMARATLGTMIRELHNKLITAAVQSTVLKHGWNYLLVTQASPVVPTIYGNTLVNLLGYDGNFEKDSNGDGVADGWASFLQGAIASIITTDVIHGTKIQRITSTPEDTALARRLEHRNKTFEAGKYYVVITDAQTDGTAEALLEAVYDATLIAVSSTTSKVLSVKFNPSTTISTGKITIQNRIALGAIGWVQFDGVRLYEIDAATYAKIDVDPEYTGKKLAEKFPYVDGVQHVTCPMITKVGKNMLPPFTEWTLNAGDNIKGPYEVELTSGGAIPAIDTTFSVINGQKYTVSVSLPTNAFMQIRKTNGSAYVNVSGGAGVRTATFTATEDAVIFRRYTTQGGTFLFSNPQLELGSVATPFEPRNDDYLYGISDSTGKPLKLAGWGGVRDSLTYRDGAWWKIKRWQTDVVLDGSFPWSLESDNTGFKRVRINKLVGANVTISGRQHCTRYDGRPMVISNAGTQPDEAYLWQSSGVLYITIADTESGWAEGYNPIGQEISAFMNGWMAKTVDVNGKPTAWKSKLDGSDAPTQTLAYVSANKAPGWTGWATLHYQLAKPVEEVVTVEGGLSAHSGGNMFEVSSGVIVREKVIPVTNGAGLRYINRGDHVEYEPSKLKIRVDKILAVYINDSIDKRWIIQTDGTAYGKQRAQITEADIDPTADYYVTYMPLDRYAITSNLGETAIQYESNLSSVISSLVREMADNQTKDSVQDWLLLQDGAYLDNLRIDINAHGTLTTGVHGATASNTANRIVARDNGGRAQFNDPVANQDAATKAWVEAQLASAKSYAP